MTRLALIACLAASPALAQQAFDPAPLEACLQAADSDIARQACIGQGSDACMTGELGGSNAGMGLCYGGERDWWDARLNAAFQILLKAEEAAEADAKKFGYAAPPTVEPLRQMQRAWIGFRDAACEYEHATWGGGSGGPVAVAACQMRLTAEQALALEARAKRRAGQ